MLKEKSSFTKQRIPSEPRNTLGLILNKVSTQFFLWLFGSFILGFIVIDRFPLDALLVLFLAFIVVAGLLRFGNLYGALTFLFLAATPLEGVTSQIPFVASLGRYAPPLVSFAFLCLSLISIFAISSQLGFKTFHKFKTSKVGFFAIFVLPAIFVGWPASAATMIQFLNAILMIFLVINLSRVIPRGPIEILNQLGIAIGIYALLLFLLQNPITFLQNLSSDFFIGDGNISNPNRLSGLGGDYELLAQLLAVGCVLLAQSISQTTGIRKSVEASLLVVSFLVLIATASLYGILTALIGSVLVSQDIRKKKKLSISFLPIAGVAVVLGTALQVILSRLQARRFPLEDLTDLFTDPARVLNRSTVWERVMSDSDFQQVGLLGLGWPFPLARFETFPHSMFLTVYITSGFLGLAFFCFVWLKFVRSSFKLLLRREYLHVGLVALTLLGGNILNEVTRLGSFIIFFVLVLSCTMLLFDKREI